MPYRDKLTWIELSRSAFKKNLKAISDLAGSRSIAIPVKANGYGHGLPQIVKLLIDQPKVDYLCVHSLDEARACRNEGWERKILLVGPPPLSLVADLFDLNIEPLISTAELLNRLGKISSKRKEKIRTHLKLETGTNRQGITEKQLPAIAKIYKKYPYLAKPYGVAMHFANIEDTTNHEYAQTQLIRFKQLISKLSKLSVKPKISHTACSAALILFDKTRFELVRPGISFYGHWPSNETLISYKMSGGRKNLFKPILSWKTRVTQIKDIPADSFIGYGCSYRTTAKTKIAILPIGYSDGYSRSLSSVGYVLIKGRRAPIRGRICMNLTMVDITDIPGVKLEDEVILIGSQKLSNNVTTRSKPKAEVISAEQLANWSGTINYEILGRLSATIPRYIMP